MDQIRVEVGCVGFGSDKKIVVIYDLPGTKAEREFLIEICSKHNADVSIFLWDSDGSIKVDPKTKKMSETWNSFITSIKSIPNSKVVSYGEDFSDKEDDDEISYIRSLFTKYGKTIPYEAASLMSQIVGRKRGMLLSEVEKLVLTCPNPVTVEFISEACFPVAQDAILWKLGNVIDNCNFLESIKATKEFIENDVHPNVIAEILAKKARWQLAACHLWSQGMSWGEVESILARMGKFPSVVWHNDQLGQTEKKASDKLKEPDAAYDFLSRQLGIPMDYLSALKEKGAKVKGGESLPMPFLAGFITKFIQNKIVIPNSSGVKPDELRRKVLARAIKVYLGVTDRLKDLRYNNNAEQEIFDMVKLLVDVRL